MGHFICCCGMIFLILLVQLLQSGWIGCFTGSVGYQGTSYMVQMGDATYMDIFPDFNSQCLNHCRASPFMGIEYHDHCDGSESCLTLNCLCGDHEPEVLKIVEDNMCIYDAPEFRLRPTKNPVIAVFWNEHRLCIFGRHGIIQEGKFQLSQDKIRNDVFTSSFSYNDCWKNCLHQCMPVIGITYSKESNIKERFLECTCAGALPGSKLNQHTTACPTFKQSALPDDVVSDHTQSLLGDVDQHESIPKLNWTIIDNNDKSKYYTVLFQDYETYQARCGRQTEVVTKEWVIRPNTSTELMQDMTDDTTFSDSTAYYTAMILGIVSGIVFAILLAILAILLILLWRKRDVTRSDTDQQVCTTDRDPVSVAVVSPCEQSTSNQNDNPLPDHHTIVEHLAIGHITPGDKVEGDYAELDTVKPPIYAVPKRKQEDSSTADDVTVEENVIYSEL